MKERKLVHQFTLDTEIYDVELPQKVLSVLRAEPLETDPRFYYCMSTVFDKAVYQTRDFFQYPLEKMPLSFHGRRGRASEQDLLCDWLSAILRQQLSRVSSAVRNTGIDLSGGAIIGDDLEQSHQVTLEFYEEREKSMIKRVS